MSKFKIVTFDMTGTLLKFRRPVGEIYASVGQKFGLRADPESLSRNFKRGWSLMNSKYPNYGLGSIGWEEWWKELVFLSFDAVYNKSEMKGREAMINDAADCLIDLYKTDRGWRLEDNAMPLLEYLLDKKITVGAISNFDARLGEIMRRLRIAEYFKFVVTSYEASYLKPDLNIFRAAENLYERTTGKEFERASAIHVGDSFLYDYSGALNAGWNAALISPNLRNLKADHPNIAPNSVFSSLKEFKAYLEK